mmetsp:Transcript_22185/g.59842  ORF Transcript_22185/g.59842 Transcript_22185/m.59842 type:complete len:345 (-) Transcript_22185:26-1060(-)
MVRHVRERGAARGPGAQQRAGCNVQAGTVGVAGLCATGCSLGGLLLLLATVGLEDILDQRLLNGQELGKLLLELRAIELVVGAPSSKDLGLLLKREVLPGEGGVVVLLVHLQDLVVRHHARVREVPDAREPAARHLEGDGHHLREHRHAVGNVNYFGVARDLVDEIAMELQVVADGHTHPQDARVWVVFHHVLHVGLGVGVEGAVEVGLVLLLEADARAELMLVIVLKDAPRGEHGAVDTALVGEVRQIERADDVHSDGLRLVRLAPVHVWPASHTRSVEHVCWLHLIKLLGEGLAILEASGGKLELDALFRAHLAQPAPQPARATKDEDVHVLLRHRCRGCHD